VPIVSNPKKLTVPDEASYPINRLWLFDWQDRVSWERAFGEQAPPFDAGRAPKHWADTSVLEGVDDPDGAHVEYDYFDSDSRSFQKLRLSVREAATPNIPGVYKYPEYVVAPTPAVVVGSAPGEEGPLNPSMLCHRSEAEQLAGEIGGDSVIENTYSDAGPYRIEWRGETRRMWLIRKSGHYHGAGLVLKEKHKNGVGAPGHWTTERAAKMTWVPDEIAASNERQTVPIPCRRPAANEALYLGHPMKVVVYRTDRESEFNQPVEIGAGFPPDLRAAIERIDANVQQLMVLNALDRT